MSIIKKTVIAFLVIILGILFAVNANATGNIKLGGTFVNDTDSTFNASWDQKWESFNVSVDYTYKESDNIVKLDKFNTVGKYNYKFSEELYAFAITSYDTDKFRSSGDRTVFGSGVGYNWYSTENFKLSTESSVALLTNNFVDEAIFRQNITTSYKLFDNLEVSNKLLFESGTETYLKSETDVTYLIGTNLTVGLRNRYTEDPVSNNVLSFNVGYKY